jgi:hypothetical protein
MKYKETLFVIEKCYIKHNNSFSKTSIYLDEHYQGKSSVKCGRQGIRETSWNNYKKLLFFPVALQPNFGPWPPS